MLAPFTQHLARLVARAPVRNLDETGFRIGGRTQWLHTASTPDLTHYRVSSKRGAMPEDFEGGVIVHDHFSPYYNLPGVDHALCNAHHLRELKALIDIEKEPWARKMSKLLRIALRAVHSAENAGATALSTRKCQRLSSVYDAITAEGIALHEAQLPLVRAGVRGRYPRRPGHNLLIRLTCFKADTLRFIADFAVPFTNNQAERDIRMMKVKMKISGGFRTQAGAEIFATIRATLSTGRKQGWNILDTLSAEPARLIRALP
jgi:transposase